MSPDPSRGTGSPVWRSSTAASPNSPTSRRVIAGTLYHWHCTPASGRAAATATTVAGAAGAAPPPINSPASTRPVRRTEAQIGPIKTLHVRKNSKSCHRSIVPYEADSEKPMDIGSMHEEIQANGGIFFFWHAHVQSRSEATAPMREEKISNFKSEIKSIQVFRLLGDRGSSLDPSEFDRRHFSPLSNLCTQIKPRLADECVFYFTAWRNHLDMTTQADRPYCTSLKTACVPLTSRIPMLSCWEVVCVCMQCVIYSFLDLYVIFLLLHLHCGIICQITPSVKKY